MVTFTAVVVAILTSYGVNKSMNNSNAELSDLALANLEVLAQSEDGDNRHSYSVDCYSTYNNCWFWDCTTIYRCNVSNCQTVSADAYSNHNYCFKR